MKAELKEIFPPPSIKVFVYVMSAFKPYVKLGSDWNVKRMLLRRVYFNLESKLYNRVDNNKFKDP